MALRAGKSVGNIVGAQQNTKQKEAPPEATGSELKITRSGANVTDDETGTRREVPARAGHASREAVKWVAISAVASGRGVPDVAPVTGSYG